MKKGVFLVMFFMSGIALAHQEELFDLQEREKEVVLSVQKSEDQKKSAQEKNKENKFKVFQPLISPLRVLSFIAVFYASDTYLKEGKVKDIVQGCSSVGIILTTFYSMLF